MSKRKAIAVLAMGVLLLAACGSRLTDEQRAALVTNGRAGDGLAAGGATATSLVDPTATSIAVDAGTGDAGGGGGEVIIEEGGGGGGEGGGGGVAAGETCGGGGASDVGVTDTEIKIGNVSTISGPIPGFGQTGVNAVKAYINFVNATGGVCGRQLVLEAADDGLVSGNSKARHDTMKESVLGFVGGTTVVDDGAAQSLDGTEIVYTGLAITDAMITSPNNFPVVPIDLADGGNGALAIFNYMKQVEGASKGGIVFPSQAAAKARAQGYKVDMERAGIQVVMNQEVDVVETNYAPVAATVESEGVDVLVTTLEVTGMSNLARDLKTNGYFPKVPFYGAQAYGRDFLSRAQDAGDPTVLGLAYAILEDRGSIKMVDDFITWYERTNPGSDIDFFAIMSWVAADLYVSSLRSIEGEPTRSKLFEKLKATSAYDASGMIASINPAGKKGAACFMVAKVKSGEWFRDHPPGSGFECGY